MSTKKLRLILTPLMFFILTITPFFSSYADSSPCNLFFQNSPFCANLQWIHSPEVRKDSPFTLEFFSKEDGGSISMDEIEMKIKLWMPSMNHGSSPVRLEKKSSSLFQVNRVFFSMPGQWEIRFNIKNRNIENSEDTSTWTEKL